MRFLSLFALLFAVAAPVAHADAAPKHEALINSQFGTTVNAQLGKGDGFLVNAGYLYGLGGMFQLGGQLGFGYSGSEFLNAMVLANLNFDINPKHTLFVGGGVGWTGITKSATRQFVWTVDLGTRCQIVEHVYWRPTVGVTDQGGGVFFRANLLAMSITY